MTAPELRPLPKFGIGLSVKVPPEISDQMQATVISREWGPDRKKMVAGWVYGVAFVFGGAAFEVRERELSQWQK